ncbi:MAG: hypothetical protein J6N49_02225 [Alphaproteobacteria bacterium]|nr:hypothetical protein [Alphaproteobacteria bacterium]
MEYKVMGKSLKRDISAFVRLKKANFTPNVYNRQQDITDRADNILEHYRLGDLRIDPKDYPILAEYIEKFGSYHKEEMLDKLQSSVDFDVRIYLEDKSKSLWQRLFPKKENPTLKASQMKSAIKKYVLMSRKAEHNLFDNPHLTVKIEKLKQESDSHIQSFLNGKLEILPADLETFKQYIKTFNPTVYEGGLAKQALDAIEKLQQTADKNTTHTTPKTLTLRKPVIISFGFKRKTENLWARLKKGLKSFWSSHKPSAPKVRLPQISGSTLWQRLKIAAVTGLVVAAGAFGLKSSEASHGNDGKVVKKHASLSVDTKTVKAASKKNVTTVQFTQVQQEQQVKNKQAEKEARIWQNYYDSTVDILAPTVNIDKNVLYNKIQNQLDKGILSLPEGVTKEKVALNYVLFKAYGLNSSLDNALNTAATLTAEQQASFARDAGIKQTDIKQIALKKHGKLLSYSAYNHAHKNVQKRYTQNLKELRQLKKHSLQRR